jgi:hypothetical protein
MNRLLAIALIASLAACAQTHDVVTSCPVAKTYDKAFEKAWGDELAKLPTTDPLVIVSGDYIGLRDQAKACQAAR